MYKFGCIGIGNMGGAVAQALVQAAGGGSLMVSSRTREKAEAAAARLGCMAGDNRDLAAQCQYLFLGVKPQILPGVLEELAPVLGAGKALVCWCPWRQASPWPGCRAWRKAALWCGLCPTLRSLWGPVWCCTPQGKG